MNHSNILEVDALGLRCPMPILKMKKVLAQVSVGDVILLLTDDPHARSDVQAFCKQTTHLLLEQNIIEEGRCLHLVQKSK